MKRKVVAVFLTALVALLWVGGGSEALFAQSNAVIDDILANERMTYGHAVYILGVADGTIPERTSVADAHRQSQTDGLYFGYEREDPVSLGEFSLMLMETFDVPGGLMYTVLPSPRYAARELAFRNVIQGDAYPRMAISGERAMRIIGRVLALQEEGRLR